MTDAILHYFPRREGDRIVHESWVPDLGAAHRVNRMGTRHPSRLATELAEMARHFPRWVLTIANGRNPKRCRKCQGMLVFDRGLRCVACKTEVPIAKLPKKTRLAFFGLLPPIGLDGLTTLRGKLNGRAPKRHILGRNEELGTYLLVPLTAVFPEEYPKRPIEIAYQAGFFELPGVPKDPYSHTYHMLGEGFMCLFAGGEWKQAMNCRQVLQQRAYPHVIKFLNYANGKRNAFAIVS